MPFSGGGSGGGGGVSSLPPKEFEFNALGMIYAANRPPIKLIGTNKKVHAAMFDASGGDFLYQEFQLPERLDPDGNSKVQVYFSAETPASGKEANVSITYRSGATPNGADRDTASSTNLVVEDVDVEYDSGDDILTVYEYTFANTLSGWSAGAFIQFSLELGDATSNNLADARQFIKIRWVIDRA